MQMGGGGGALYHCATILGFAFASFVMNTTITQPMARPIWDCRMKTSHLGLSKPDMRPIDTLPHEGYVSSAIT